MVCAAVHRRVRFNLHALKEETVGLFSSGGVTSANTYARLKTEKNTREIAKALQQQAAGVQGESARIQWCIDRILHLESEVARLRAELDGRAQPPS
jgi:ubiquinone biosynthesis protein UbiJ